MVLLGRGQEGHACQWKFQKQMYRINCCAVFGAGRFDLYCYLNFGNRL